MPRGMTVREIQGHLAELYSADVSPDLISRVTDAVLEEVREWQSRPLDAVYPIVFFDALRVKIRDEGLVKNKAVYVALAYNGDGEKDVLGLWIEQTEGAKFWLRVINELKARGVNDILIAVVDGLKGFPEAITLTHMPSTSATSGSLALWVASGTFVRAHRCTKRAASNFVCPSRPVRINERFGRGRRIRDCCTGHLARALLSAVCEYRLD